MQQLSISIFLPTLALGGAERALVELANGLAGRGCCVQLLLMVKEGPLVRDLSPEVDLVDLACLSYRQSVLALARYYRVRRPMIVLTSLYATGLAAIAAKAVSSHKPKVIVGAHNSLLAKAVNPDNVKDRLFLMPLCRLLFPMADGVIAVSRGVVDELHTLLKLPKKNVQTIYNPVVTPELALKTTEFIAHPWLGDSGQREFKTIVSVGRLVEQKGYDVLLAALSSVRQRLDCRLIIVGGGPLLIDLQATAQRFGIQEFVDFVGWQENPHKFVARADLFVLSSRWEGLANVLIEALACGCRVVATNCRYGPAEILEDGRYGELAAVDNPSDLAAKIIHALCATDLSSHSRATRMRRAHDFTVEAAVDQYMKYFSEISEEAPKAL